MTAATPAEPAGLPVSTVTGLLGCSKQKVYNLIDAGWLEVFPGPGTLLITRESWDRFLASAGPRTRRSAS